MDSVKQAQSIVGTGNNREKNDFYPTPSKATVSLLDNWDFDINQPIWECACGDGAISKILIDRGFGVFSTDLYDYGYGVSGIDFLSAKKYADTIITNPPFKLAEKFVYRSHEIGVKTLAMFLKLSFLEGQARKKMFELYPPTIVKVFSKRISFGVGNGKGKNNGMIAFAWFIWDSSYLGRPTIGWI